MTDQRLNIPTRIFNDRDIATKVMKEVLDNPLPSIDIYTDQFKNNARKLVSATLSEHEKNLAQGIVMDKVYSGALFRGGKIAG
jgi:hypothetical protein